MGGDILVYTFIHSFPTSFYVELPAGDPRDENEEKRREEKNRNVDFEGVKDSGLCVCVLYVY